MKIAVLATTIVAAAAFLAPAAPTLAAPYFNKSVKCQETDPEGRVIPTRVGNSALGRNHFSSKHNIRTCKIISAAVRDKVDKKEGGRLEHWGVAYKGRQIVDFVVIAQYTRKTADRQYDAGEGQVIGVVTAYCRRMTECPDWMNP
ncbi:hypothetical protein GCM10009550_73510 [Actinocorallia libanotica]|uniref:Uncharacterized protein n=2 Tax=Actinocorallia libanotica TaxID=46162 RepID=A0ABN1RZ51_9ACTN